MPISQGVIPVIPASTPCELSTDLRKLSSAVYNAVDKLGGELDERPVRPLDRPDRGSSRYFHCVETPKPAAMKPKPTTMFQFRMDSTGMEPSVT